MKKFKQSIACLLTIIFMSPLIVSCSNQESENQSVTYSQLAEKYKGIHSKIKVDVVKLNEIVSKRKSSTTNVTQEIVDSYAAELGYNNGEVSVHLVNNILNLNQEIQNTSIVEVINSKNISLFAKQSLISISQGNVLVDLDSEEDFINLSSPEKEMIVMDNIYLQESLAIDGYSKTMSPDGVMAWVVLSGLAGYLYAGPPGLVAGVLFGVYMAVMK
jgi:hypothetical protein